MRNNFITKIIGASLAIAMMIGGAVGINAAKQAKEVNAAGDIVYKSVTFSESTMGASVNNYTTESWTNTTTGDTGIAVSLAYFNNNNKGWAYVRCGNKKNASVGSIKTNSSIDMPITKVAVTIDSITAESVNSIKLFTSNNGTSWTEAGSYAKETGAKSVELNNPTENLYYKIDFDCKKGSSNGLVQVSKIDYYYVKPADPGKTIQANSVTIKSGSETISGTYEPVTPYYLGQTLDLRSSLVNYQTGEGYDEGDGDISWNSSNTDVATVSDEGVVTFVGQGVSTITATAADEGLNHAVVSASFTLDLRNAESIPGTIYQPYTVEEAIEAIDADQGVSGVYAKGFVSEIVTAYSSQYNNITFNISGDGETSGAQLQAFRCGGAEAANIAVGNLVVITGNLIYYQNTTYEFAQGCSVVSRTIPTYTVIYDANGATSGTVPTDNTNYNRNASVTVANNTGTLAKTGFDFNGWNTKADPTDDGAVHYNVGATFAITRNITLYAEWLSQEPSITVQANLSGYTGQSVDLDFSYGNIANESNLSVVAADNKVTVGNLVADGGVGAVTITFNTAGETSLSFRNNGEELATCAVVVNQSEISITGLSPRGRVQIGATLNLGSQVTINHSGIYSGDVVWESSDTDVATVSDSGVVTGKAIGQTTITVTSFDKLDVYQSCVVNVYKGPQANTLNLKIASYVATGDHLVTWTCDYAVLTNTSDPEAGASGTKATNYLGGTRTSSRMYAGNIMTITPNSGYAISSVVFTATSNGYADALRDSEWTNATATSSGANTTIVPTNGTTAFSAAIGATCGFETVKIYISPSEYLKTASTIKTISGVESDGGATVTNVALRFGGVIPVSTWNQINSNWAITDFGIMFARGSMLTARSLDSLEKVFRNDPADVAMVHRGAVGTPNANGDDYIFTARLNLEEVDYDEVFYAAPFIVAGGEYYFLQEMHYSVRTLAEECLTSGESTLSQAALTTLKGNN